MEEVCPKLRAAYVPLFSDKSPTIGWVKRLAARWSLVEMQLVWALALRLKKYEASPLTPFHISGEENSMADIPSRLFVSNLAWFCKNDIDLLNLFIKNFPLPNQTFWGVFRPSKAASMKVISVLRMHNFEMGEWLQLKKSGKSVGKLVLLCQTFGSGALATGCHVPAATSVSCMICSLRTLGPIWLIKTSYNWQSLWGALGRWHNGRFVLWSKYHKSSRRKKFSTKIGKNDGRMEEVGSTH